jgi:hypothetical protein
MVRTFRRLAGLRFSPRPRPIFPSPLALDPAGDNTRNMIAGLDKRGTGSTCWARTAGCGGVVVVHVWWCGQVMMCGSFKIVISIIIIMDYAPDG